MAIVLAAQIPSQMRKCTGTCASVQLCKYLRKCVRGQVHKYSSAQVLSQMSECASTQVPYVSVQVYM